MAADRLIGFTSLDIVDGTGRTLASSSAADGGSGIGAALGAGRFGKIVTYRYNGALVAVKSVNQCRWDGKRMYIYR